METIAFSDVVKNIHTIQFTVVSLCMAFVGFLIRKQLLGSRRIYRLPPGPRGLPIIGHMHMLGRTPHQSLMHLAEKYGSILQLRLGVCPTVVVSNPDMAREVLKIQDQHLSSRPSMEGNRILAYNGQTPSLMPYNEMHHLMRKLIATDIVSPKSLDRSKRLRNEELLNTVRDILSESHSGALVNVDDKLAILVWNQTIRSNFEREDYGGKRTYGADIADEFHSMFRSITRSSFFYPAEFLPFLKFLDLGGVGKQLCELAKKADTFYSTMLAGHRNKDGSYLHKEPMDRDFVDVLCASQQENPNQVTDEVIKGTLQDVILASTITTISTMLWALAEILRNPDILGKILNELDIVVGTDRFVQESDIDKLKYLRTVIKENFRLHPTVPLLVPHQSDSVDVKIGGYDVPAKTRVLVNVYAIGRNPQVWKNPLVFNPDRFAGSPIDVKGQHFDLLPFGSGRRMCVGYNLGLTTVEMGLAQLLHTCDFSLPKDMNPEDLSLEERPGAAIDRAQALELRVHPRLPAYVYETAGMMI